eukprot:PLAT3627.16.p1 GENE.PLAT3627.16~~PLAT3627.16.p1  ORF type:complete len:4898 (-),score=2459.63 PLAT3627.16:1724-16378(-)
MAEEEPLLDDSALDAALGAVGDVLYAYTAARVPATEAERAASARDSKATAVRTAEATSGSKPKQLAVSGPRQPTRPTADAVRRPRPVHRLAMKRKDAKRSVALAMLSYKQRKAARRDRREDKRDPTVAMKKKWSRIGDLQMMLRPPTAAAVPAIPDGGGSGSSAGPPSAAGGKKTKKASSAASPAARAAAAVGMGGLPPSARRPHPWTVASNYSPAASSLRTTALDKFKSARARRRQWKARRRVRAAALRQAAVESSEARAYLQPPGLAVSATSSIDEGELPIFPFHHRSALPLEACDMVEEDCTFWVRDGDVSNMRSDLGTPARTPMPDSDGVVRWMPCWVRSWNSEAGKFVVGWPVHTRREDRLLGRLSICFNAEPQAAFRFRLCAAKRRHNLHTHARAYQQAVQRVTEAVAPMSESLAAAIVARTLMRTLHGSDEQQREAETMLVQVRGLWLYSMRRAALEYRLLHPEARARARTLGLPGAHPVRTPQLCVIPIAGYGLRRFRQLREALADVHFTSSPDLYRITAALYERWERYEQTVLCDTDMSSLLLPTKLLNFGLAQRAHLAATLGELTNEFRDHLLYLIVDAFALSDLSKLSGEQIARIRTHVTKIDSVLSFQLSYMLRKSIDAWGALFQSSMASSSDADDEQQEADEEKSRDDGSEEDSKLAAAAAEDGGGGDGSDDAAAVVVMVEGEEDTADDSSSVEASEIAARRLLLPAAATALHAGVPSRPPLLALQLQVTLDAQVKLRPSLAEVEDALLSVFADMTDRVFKLHSIESKVLPVDADASTVLLTAEAGSDLSLLMQQARTTVQDAVLAARQRSLPLLRRFQQCLPLYRLQPKAVLQAALRMQLPELKPAMETTAAAAAAAGGEPTTSPAAAAASASPEGEDGKEGKLAEPAGAPSLAASAAAAASEAAAAAAATSAATAAAAASAGTAGAAPVPEAAEEEEEESVIELPPIDGELLAFFTSEAERYRTLADDVLSISYDAEYLGFIEVRCGAAKRALAQRLRLLSSTLADALVQQCSERFAAAHQRHEEVLNIINMELYTLEDLLTLKRGLSSYEDDIAAVADELLQPARAQWAALDRLCVSLPEDVIALAWEQLAWPQTLHAAARSCQERLDSGILSRFRSLLKRDRRQFEANLRKFAESLTMVGTFFDMELVDEYYAEVCALRERLDKAVAQAESFNAMQASFGWFLDSNDGELDGIVARFVPYESLWTLAHEWKAAVRSWVWGPLARLSPEAASTRVADWMAELAKLVRLLIRDKGPLSVAVALKEEISAIISQLQLARALLQPELRSRHWKRLSELAGVVLEPGDSLTLHRLEAAGLKEHMSDINEIVRIASREAVLETRLIAMADEARKTQLPVVQHFRGFLVLGDMDVVRQLLDEQQLVLQELRASAFVRPFEDSIASWDARLGYLQELLAQWETLQALYLQLAPMFSLADVATRIPEEAAVFRSVDSSWRALMANVSAHPTLGSVMDQEGLLQSLQDGTTRLSAIEKGLHVFLDTRRAAFPRLFFLSDAQLLEMMAELTWPTEDCWLDFAIGSVFDAITALRCVVADDGGFSIVAVRGRAGEVHRLRQSVNVAQGSKLYVDDLLSLVERSVVATLVATTEEAIPVAAALPLVDWMHRYPAQLVQLLARYTWTHRVEEAFTRRIPKEGIAELDELLASTAAALLIAARSEMEPRTRRIVSNLLCLTLQQRDALSSMEAAKVFSAGSWDWQRRLRVYWDDARRRPSLRMGLSQQFYGMEYASVAPRLVLTPATEAAFISLLAAWDAHAAPALWGAPRSGKTDTVRELAACLGRRCIKLHGSAAVSTSIVRSWVHGIAATGACALLDKMEALPPSVLACAAQFISALLRAQAREATTMLLAGSRVSVNPQSCLVFTFTSPPLAPGRSPLPRPLAARLRPLAVLRPDVAYIARLLLHSYGFSHTAALAKPLATALAGLRDLAVDAAALVHVRLLPRLALRMQRLRVAHSVRGLAAATATAGDSGKVEVEEAKSDGAGSSDASIGTAAAAEEQKLLITALTAELRELLPPSAEETALRLLAAAFPTVPAELLKLPEQAVPLPSSAVASGPEATAVATDDDELEADEALTRYLSDSLTLAAGSLSLQMTDELRERCLRLHTLLLARRGVAIVGDASAGKSTVVKLLAEALTLLKSGSRGWLRRVYPTAIGADTLLSGSAPLGDVSYLPPLLTRSQDAAKLPYNWLLLDGDLQPWWLDTVEAALHPPRTVILRELTVVPHASLKMLFETDSLASASPSFTSHVGLLFCEPVAPRTLAATWAASFGGLLGEEMLLEAFDIMVAPALDFMEQLDASGITQLRMSRTARARAVLSLAHALMVDIDWMLQRDVTYAARSSLLVAILWGLGGSLPADGRSKLEYSMQRTAARLELKTPTRSGLFDAVYLPKQGWAPWKTLLMSVEMPPRRGSALWQLLVPTMPLRATGWVTEQALRHGYAACLEGPPDSGKSLLASFLLQTRMSACGIAGQPPSRISLHGARDGIRRAVERLPVVDHSPLGMAAAAAAAAAAASAAAASATAAMDYVSVSPDFIDAGSAGAAGAAFVAAGPQVLWVDDVHVGTGSDIDMLRALRDGQPLLLSSAEQRDTSGLSLLLSRTLSAAHIRASSAAAVAAARVTARAPADGGGVGNGCASRHQPCLLPVGQAASIADEQAASGSQRRLMAGLLHLWLPEATDDSLVRMLRPALEPILRRRLTPLLNATLEMFRTLQADASPRRGRWHSVVTVKDPIRVLNGCLLVQDTLSASALASLWLNESLRVYSDRMIDSHGRRRVQQTLRVMLKKHLRFEWSEVVSAGEPAAAAAAAAEAEAAAAEEEEAESRKIGDDDAAADEADSKADDALAESKSDGDTASVATATASAAAATSSEGGELLYLWTPASIGRDSTPLLASPPPTRRRHRTARTRRAGGRARRLSPDGKRSRSGTPSATLAAAPALAADASISASKSWSLVGGSVELLRPKGTYTLLPTLSAARDAVASAMSKFESWQGWQGVHAPTGGPGSPRSGRSMLIPFDMAVRHIVRMLRTLAQPYGSLALLGGGGVGRNTWVRVAARMLRASVAALSPTQWHSQLRDAVLQAGDVRNQQPVVLLVNAFKFDSQPQAAMWDALHALLRGGRLSGLVEADELRVRSGFGGDGGSEVASTVGGSRPATAATAATEGTAATADGSGSAAPSPAPAASAAAAAAAPTSAGAASASMAMENAFWERAIQQLRVVVIVDAGSRMYEWLSAGQLMSHFVIDWLPPWPLAALRAIAQEHMATLNLERLPEERMVDATVAVQRSMQPHGATGKHFTHLLAHFAVLFNKQVEEWEVDKARLVSAGHRLRQIAAQHQRLAGELKAMAPTLVETADRIASLQERVDAAAVAAAETQADCSAFEAHMQAKRDDALALHASIEDANAEWSTAAEAIAARLEAMTRKQLLELRGVKVKTDGVVLMAEAVCRLFRVTPPQTTTGRKQWYEAARRNVWNDVDKVHALRDFRTDKIKEDARRLLLRLPESAAWQGEEWDAHAEGVRIMADWVAFVAQSAVYHADMRVKTKALRVYEVELGECDETFRGKLRALAAVEATLSGLQETLAGVKKEADELDRRSSSGKSVHDRATRVLSAFAGHILRLEELGHQRETILPTLLGDTLLGAASVVFHGPLSQAERVASASGWMSSLETLRVPTSSPAVPRHLEHPTRVREWRHAGLSADAQSLDSAIIAQHAVLWPLLVDPQQRAVAWLRATSEDVQVARSWAPQSVFIRRLQRAARAGQTLLVELPPVVSASASEAASTGFSCALQLPAALHPLLERNPAVLAEEGVRLALSEDVRVDVDAGFRLFLLAHSEEVTFRAALPAAIARRVTLCSFGVSQDSVMHDVMAAALAVHAPDVASSARDALHAQVRNEKLYIELEAKLLDRLSNDTGELLQNDSAVDHLVELSERCFALQEALPSGEAEDERQLRSMRAQLGDSLNELAAALLLFSRSARQLDPFYAVSYDRLLAFVVDTLRGMQGSTPLMESAPAAWLQPLLHTLVTHVCRAVGEEDSLLLLAVLAMLCGRSSHARREEARHMTRGIALPLDGDALSVQWQWETCMPDDHMRLLLKQRLSAEDAALAAAATASLARSHGAPTGRAAATKAMIEEVAAAVARLPKEDVRNLLMEHLREYPRLWQRSLADARVVVPRDAHGLLPTEDTLLLRVLLRPEALESHLRSFIAFELDESFLAPINRSLPTVVRLWSAQRPLLLREKKAGSGESVVVSFAERHRLLHRLIIQPVAPRLRGRVREALKKAAHDGQWLLLLDIEADAIIGADVLTLCEEGGEECHSEFRVIMTTSDATVLPSALVSACEKLDVRGGVAVGALMRTAVTAVEKEWREVSDRPALLGLAYFHAFLTAHGDNPLVWRGAVDVRPRHLLEAVSRWRSMDEATRNVVLPSIVYGGALEDDNDIAHLRVVYEESVQPTGCRLDGYPGTPPDMSFRAVLAWLAQQPASSFALTRQSTTLTDAATAARMLDGLAALMPMLQPRTAIRGRRSSSSAILAATSRALGGGGAASLPPGHSRISIETHLDVSLRARELLAALPSLLDIEDGGDGEYDSDGGRPAARRVSPLRRHLMQEAACLNRLLSAVRLQLTALLSGCARAGWQPTATQAELVQDLLAARVPMSWQALGHATQLATSEWVTQLALHSSSLRSALGMEVPLASLSLPQLLRPATLLLEMRMAFAAQAGVPLHAVEQRLQPRVRGSSAPLLARFPDSLQLNGMYLAGAVLRVDTGKLSDLPVGKLYSKLPPVVVSCHVRQSGTTGDDADGEAAAEGSSGDGRAASFACPLYRTLRAKEAERCAGERLTLLLPTTGRLLRRGYWSKLGVVALCEVDLAYCEH